MMGNMALLIAVLAAGTALSTPSARAAKVDGAVFTMTNSALRGNRVVAYERRSDGSLRLVDTYATGGVGGGPAPTTTVLGDKVSGPNLDSLGSQRSLILSEDHSRLFAVNAGSNTVSCFQVNASGPGPLLGNARSVGSGGIFPVSLALRGDVLYVLNSGNKGNVTGFRLSRDCTLTRIPGGKSEPLNSLIEDPPFPRPRPNEVITTAAQVNFTPDGSKLVVAIKGGPKQGVEGLPEGDVVVFDVDADGKLAGAPKVNHFSGDTKGPFSFIFDKNGNVVLNFANSFTVASYEIRKSGALEQIGDPVVLSGLGGDSPVGFPAVNCWIARFGNIAYVMSFGSLPALSDGVPDGPGVITALRIRNDGTLAKLPTGGSKETKGVVAVLPQDDPAGFDPEHPKGTFGNHGIDLTVIENGGRGFVYAIEPRIGKIGAWRIKEDGTLRSLGLFDGGLTEGVDPFPGTNPGINDFLERCFLQSGKNLSPECRRGSAQGVVGF